jgi:sterol desaturase/sphingolipid hydroxylase (fatty acid hydroxylase superfamily)
VFAVILFEIILNATAIFNHANLAIPKSIDKVLRLLLVTPDMHRIHHSRERKEHDTNFGFALSVWDRIFKTYKNDPIGGQSEMQVGLDWQDDNPAKLTWALFLPFKE